MSGLLRKNERVVFREVKEGGVLLDLETGEYFSLNRLGCRIWAEADGRSVEHLQETLRSELPEAPETMEDDVDAFVSELEKRGLIAYERGG